LKQPFAELVISGRKKIEIRKWNTKFRGKFLIHASKNSDREAMERFGFEELPCGFIVGEAELIDVKKYIDEKDFEKDKNKHLATRNFGEYGFILKNIKRVEPVEARGMLGFWELGSSKV
ncbi:ASCH domain-containing protein, partial [Candidatus Pacearchaeota archaeon]|nr:ASCH domain-containing protein [Candidatus Pacearchaeota archaeon]